MNKIRRLLAALRLPVLILAIVGSVAQASTPVTIGGTKGIYFPTVFQGTVQVVAYTTHAESSAFGANTRVILISCSTDCFFLVSTAGTAATTSNATFLPAKTMLFMGVAPAQKISVVQSASGGNLNVTEGS